MANRETLQKTLNANYDLDFFHRNVLHPVFGNSLTITSVPEKRNINASEERLIKSIKNTERLHSLITGNLTSMMLNLPIML